MKITAILENTKHHQQFIAKHGLSLYIETKQANIICDLGPDDSYLKNAQLLNIDLHQADAVVISHGHSDHIGGLNYLNKVNQHAPIYLSPHALDPHWLKLGPYYHQVGATPAVNHAYSHRMKFVNADMEIAEGVHIMHLQPTDAYTKNLYKGEEKALDDFNHEIMLVIESEKGLVLFSGCSHHGIVHMTKTVLNKFPNKQIAAIIGGFHLIGLPIINTLGKTKEEIIAMGHTLNELPITRIYSCHCTGPKGYTILQTILKEKLDCLLTGKTIEIAE
ncbi:MBL fold metallo-hydrolase [Lysinibacillus sp. KU-BSD001]|uniref:MBL fold metallo-hydrolase n=1 Tax=Lysinibacillus sp. KU-BSD001 TaxID=3141328 RepID=UPI0036EB5829